MAKKAGRPPSGGPKPKLEIRMPRELLDKINATAKAFNRSTPDFVREYLEGIVNRDDPNALAAEYYRALAVDVFKKRAKA